jgi:hypothetical protein
MSVSDPLRTLANSIITAGVRSTFALALTAGAVACIPTPRVDAASEQLFAKAVSICALLGDPKPFVGKRVTVSGYLFPTPHGGVFHDDGCDRGEIPLSRDNYEADNKLARAIRDAAWRADSHADVPVVMSGIWEDHFKGDALGFMCSGGGICQRYSLQADSLVAARPPSGRPRR